ncbi:MAG TPA: hypothetical protein VEW28_04555 [Candidatus Kapabacteria bacterium]|nr:hypothetical protein [Candidatus Kapabacteria bacterium]
MKKTTTYSIFLALIVAVSLLFSIDSYANRRHFSFVYETPVLSSGNREVEIWNTIRTDKGVFYRGMDHRVEYEWGLGSGFQSSLYLNLNSESTLDATGGITNENQFGFSNEWKWSLSNPVADAIGSALYGEWTVDHDATELEGKLILDKQIGNILLAGNAVFEREFAAHGDGSYNNIEATFGAAYIANDHFSFGLEARHQTVALKDNSFPAFYAGPSISYSADKWWTVVSVLPQIGIGSNKNNTNNNLELEQHEKLQIRVLLSFEL